LYVEGLPRLYIGIVFALVCWPISNCQSFVGFLAGSNQTGPWCPSQVQPGVRGSWHCGTFWICQSRASSVCDAVYACDPGSCGIGLVVLVRGGDDVVRRVVSAQSVPAFCYCAPLCDCIESISIRHSRGFHPLSHSFLHGAWRDTG